MTSKFFTNLPTLRFSWFGVFNIILAFFMLLALGFGLRAIHHEIYDDGAVETGHAKVVSLVEYVPYLITDKPVVVQLDVSPEIYQRTYYSVTVPTERTYWVLVEKDGQQSAIYVPFSTFSELVQGSNMPITYTIGRYSKKFTVTDIKAG